MFIVYDEGTEKGTTADAFSENEITDQSKMHNHFSTMLELVSNKK